jgi:hypothetical protein
VIKEGCCWTCGKPLGASRVQCAHYCSRECLLVMLDWEECTELRVLLTNSRWFGGAGFKEEPLEEYLRARMRDGVGALSTSSELLAEVLVEILRGCS